MDETITCTEMIWNGYKYLKWGQHYQLTHKDDKTCSECTENVSKVVHTPASVPIHVHRIQIRNEVHPSTSPDNTDKHNFPTSFFCPLQLPTTQLSTASINVCWQAINNAISYVYTSLNWSNNVYRSPIADTAMSFMHSEKQQPN